MKAFLLSILFGAVALANVPGARTPDEMLKIDASVNNIPTAYDATAGSQVKTNMHEITRIQIFNTGTELLAVSVSDSSCSGSNKDNYLVPANSGGNTIEMIVVKKNLCLRSLGAAVVAGEVYVSAW